MKGSDCVRSTPCLSTKSGSEHSNDRGEKAKRDTTGQELDKLVDPISLFGANELGPDQRES